MLMEQIEKKELEDALQSFQKDKSPGPNGLPSECYITCSNFIGNYLLSVVYYSHFVTPHPTFTHLYKLQGKHELSATMT